MRGAQRKGIKMSLGYMCREDFLEEVVLDLSLDMEEREERVSLLITARARKGCWGNSGEQLF